MNKRLEQEKTGKGGLLRDEVHKTGSNDPDQIAYKQYMMLTEENKEKVNRYVESLKAEQYTPAP